MMTCPRAFVSNNDGPQGDCLRRISAAEIFWKRSACSFVRTTDHTNRGASAMWQQYKKRFGGMQFVIALVAVMVFMATRNWITATTFLVTMELGSLLGAAWAARLKRKIQGQSW